MTEKKLVSANNASQARPTTADLDRYKVLQMGLRRLRRGKAVPAAQLSMLFVSVGGKTLGIQIATSRKA